ncbi:MAG: Rrf2 family transcriptional regulator [Candidatus Latescibacteria bacterium]|nr:Rrf2 family transcriptional regulator [Candidatus Latescibacterota bacterium]
MFLSRACTYGVRATLFLATRPDAQPVLVKDIAERLGIPFHFLGKIVQGMVKTGVLVSYKGRNGGVALARPTDQIKLREVVEAIDGPDLLKECVLGLPECSGDHPCPLHAQWSGIRGEIETMLGEKNVAEMMDGLAERVLRPNPIATA